MAIILVISLILTFSVFLFIILFGSLPEFEGSFVHRLRNIILSPFHYLFDLDKKHLNGYAITSLRRLYTAYEPYLLWLIPIGYIALISFCLYLFYKDCYPRIEGWGSRNIAIPLVSFLPFISTLLACFSNPGRIDRSNVNKMLQSFQFDGIIFPSGNDCRTCKQSKPARSKHCRTCNHCVAMFDHHCIWINNCVGYYNYRWFLFYVISNQLLLSYGFILTRRILALVVKEGGFSSGIFTRWANVIVSSPANRSAGCLMLLCAILPWLTAVFLFEHIKYIYLGVTTNETMKWDEVKYCIDDGVLYQYDYSDPEAREASHLANDHSIVLQKLPDGTFNRTLTAEEIDTIQQRNLTLTQVKTEMEINNIYDQGFWNNLRQRIFPEDLG